MQAEGGSMNKEINSASDSAKSPAADAITEHKDNTINLGLTPSARYEAICKGIENGSFTATEATEILKYFGYDTGVNLIPASSINPEPISWIWNGYLAAGKLHILAGVPGTGKTTIALDFAATISLGRAWPDGSSCIVGNILIWSGEDDPKDTLVPRLIAMGADRNNIHFVGEVKGQDTEPRPFNPATDVPDLLKKANEIGNIKLIIVDPIIHAVTGDSHKNGDVRNSLKPLVELATQLNAAILGITHFTKGTQGKEPLDRVTGSLAFGAVARIVLVTAKDATSSSESRSLLARAKSNIGLFGGGFYYRIVEANLPNFAGIITSKIVWLEEALGSAQELLCQPDDHLNELSTLQEAQEYLTSILTDGAMVAKDVYQTCNNAGFSKSTVNRAKKALGIKPYKVGFGKESVWMWSLLLKIVKETKGTQPETMSIFDKNEHLRTQLQIQHPPIIEGYALKAILDLADPQDYEDLQDIDVLRCFTQDMIRSGKLRNK